MSESREHTPLPNKRRNVIAEFYRNHPVIVGGALGSVGTLAINAFKKPLGKFLHQVADYSKRAGTNAFNAIVNTPFHSNDAENYYKDHKNTMNDKNY